MKKQSSLQINSVNSHIVIKELLKESVQEFAVGVGYRHNPLLSSLFEFSKNNILNATSFFEERTLGYFALGKSKALQKPSCIIVTSGTAVAELLPSVIEAFETKTPLIIISCDRPAKFRHTHFNQTIDQVGIFKDYAQLQLDISLSDPQLEAEALQSNIRCAAQTAKKGFIAHLNLQFEKPLSNPKNKQKTAHILPYNNYSYIKTLDQESLSVVAETLNSSKNGLIILGEMTPNQDVSVILQLAKKLDSPIIPDISSNYRTIGKDILSSVPYYNTIISTNNFPTKKGYDYILHLGNRLISSDLIQWLTNIKSEQYIQVTNHKKPFNPSFIVTDHINLDPCNFSLQIIDSIKERKNFNQAKQAGISSHFDSTIEQYFNNEEKLSEPLIMHKLSSLEQETAFFFGNSLSVRAANDFFFPTNKSASIYTNRGASGIDGLLATAVGIAEVENRNKKQLIAVMGDLSFLYDLPSLLLIQKLQPNITIILFNNQGSGIAHSLPLKEQSEEFFNAFCQEKTSCNYKTLLKSFNIDYYNPTTKNHFNDHLLLATSNTKPTLLEINTDPEYTNLCWKDNLHKHLNETKNSKDSFPYFKMKFN